MRGPCTFKQRDVTAAIRAARSAGIEVKRVIVDREGRIVIETGATGIDVAPINPWDDLGHDQNSY